MKHVFPNKDHTSYEGVELEEIKSWEDVPSGGFLRLAALFFFGAVCLFYIILA